MIILRLYLGAWQLEICHKHRYKLGRVLELSFTFDLYKHGALALCHCKFIVSILKCLGINTKVEVERLAAALEHDTDTVRRVLRNMMDRYEADDRGIQIIELDGSFQMCTKSSMYESIIKIAHVPKKHVLTEVLLVWNIRLEIS